MLVGVGGSVCFEGVYRRYSQVIPSSQCLSFSIGGGVGRFVPVVMVVERWDVAVTGALYWKGLPTRTLVFERCAPKHK
jgi:hypothetical protein